ncbi:MAG: inositol monophosphatase [Candidatus Marinimicrobia bacterium]|nr:inositol monophosphatase [Candidatus Neomarinimicrobiota bacterium]
MMDLNHIRDVAVKAGKSAAELILSAKDRPKVAGYKGRANLVTKTDTESEQLICEIIHDEFPDHGILAEESGSSLPESTFQWIIDPLDGTTNFVHNYPSFAISIGVYYHHKAMVGCIIELPANHVYTAVKNQGAYCNDSSISVSTVNELKKSLLVTGFGYEHGELWERNMILFKRFTDMTQGVRRLGAAAVDLCHVASGKVDGFWEFDLHPWDSAAGVLIVEEAGGKITQMDGSAYSIFDNQILASNSLIHEEMKQIIND